MKEWWRHGQPFCHEGSLTMLTVIMLTTIVSQLMQQGKEGEGGGGGRGRGEGRGGGAI